jgi:hypothetical protein
MPSEPPNSIMWNMEKKSEVLGEQYQVHSTRDYSCSGKGVPKHGRDAGAKPTGIISRRTTFVDHVTITIGCNLSQEKRPRSTDLDECVETEGETWWSQCRERHPTDHLGNKIHR